jgi:predicted deacylase
VDVNDRVSAGDLLGRVVDLYGKVLFDCRTDTAGTVILIRHLPRVVTGDALGVVIPVGG